MNQTVSDGESIFQAVVLGILNPVYQLVAVVAFLYFLYGALMFMVHLNDPKERETGKRHLLWGLVGVFIIFSVGGILPWFTDIFGGMFSY